MGEHLWRELDQCSKFVRSSGYDRDISEYPSTARDGCIVRCYRPAIRSKFGKADAGHASWSTFTSNPMGSNGANVCAWFNALCDKYISIGESLRLKEQRAILLVSLCFGYGTVLLLP